MSPQHLKQSLPKYMCSLVKDVFCLQAVSERLTMKAPEKNINGSMNSAASSDPDLLAASEPQTFLYLHQCFERLMLQSTSQKVSGQWQIHRG